MINDIFNTLDDWRLLPGYQLERRADIFFGLHLKHIWQRLHKDDVLEIIPEFPIRKGLLPIHNKFNPENPKEQGVCKGPNGSFQIDYMVIGTNGIYLIELKTDIGSRNEKQNWYLTEAAKLSINKLVGGVEEISKATLKKHRRKYQHLLDKLDKQSLLQRETEVYSERINSKLIEVHYIQPTKDGNDTISFDEIEKAISDLDNPVTLRFRTSLQKWKTLP